MVIKAKANSIRTGASVVARSRTRRAINLDAPCTLATYVVDLSITDHDRLLGATMVVGEARGHEADALERLLSPDGTADTAACLSFLLEEAMAALGSATGAKVGTPEVFVEQVPAK